MGAPTFLPIEILDYVQTHAPPDDSPFGISQKELARALGYHPCSMSRPMDALVEEGLLSSQRRLVRDGVRKQITYRLTEQGRSRLRSGRLEGATERRVLQYPRGEGAVGDRQRAAVIRGGGR